MRVPFRVAVRRGEKIEYEDAIVWSDELPPEYRRGRNRKMKSRQYKQLRQRRPEEEKPVRRSARRGDRGRD